jgi:hypothetical protein
MVFRIHSLMFGVHIEKVKGTVFFLKGIENLLYLPPTSTEDKLLKICHHLKHLKRIPPMVTMISCEYMDHRK